MRLGLNRRIVCAGQGEFCLQVPGVPKRLREIRARFMEIAQQDSRVGTRDDRFGV